MAILPQNDPLTRVHAEGASAYRLNISRMDNPYTEWTPKFFAWDAGYAEEIERTGKADWLVCMYRNGG